MDIEENTLEDVNQDTYLEEDSEVEELEEDEVDSQVENIEEDDVDYASHAKVQGWSPKEKWRGNPDDWVDRLHPAGSKSGRSRRIEIGKT